MPTKENRQTHLSIYSPYAAATAPYLYCPRLVQRRHWNSQIFQRHSWIQNGDMKMSIFQRPLRMLALLCSLGWMAMMPAHAADPDPAILVTVDAAINAINANTASCPSPSSR